MHRSDRVIRPSARLLLQFLEETTKGAGSVGQDSPVWAASRTDSTTEWKWIEGNQCLARCLTFLVRDPQRFLASAFRDVKVMGLSLEPDQERVGHGEAHREFR